MRSMRARLVLVLVALSTALPAFSQQAAPPGSPAATTSIDGKQLPPPDPPFGGVIKDNALQSKPWWAPRVVPPKGAPNVLLIMTDDVGLRRSEHVRRRHSDAGARSHREGRPAVHAASTPPRCARPTRAALITGRNHHSAGFGVISEQSTGFPGYNSIIGKDKATIGRILSDNGYCHLLVRQGPQHAHVHRQPGRAVRPVADRAWASSTSTASSAATRTSGSRTSSATRPRSIRTSATPAGTSRPPRRTRPSRG